MGGRVESRRRRPPLRIAELLTATTCPVASAQVKSAVLLAGLHAGSVTRVREPAPTRDHTERALEAFGVPVDHRGGAIAVTGGSALRPLALTVPGDPSSAAFWAVAAAVVPDSDVTIEAVGLNPTRTAFLDVLRRTGADIEVHVENRSGGEPLGNVRVRSGSLRDVVVGAAEVPALIDELPVLGALAAHGPAVEVTGAAELRHKESDRISAPRPARPSRRVRTADGFRAGARACPREPRRTRPATSAGDGVAVAALAAARPAWSTAPGAADVSYPGFSPPDRSALSRAARAAGAPRTNRPLRPLLDCAACEPTRSFS